MSQPSLKVALEQQLRGADMCRHNMFQEKYCISQLTVPEPDFAEGMISQLVDKDNKNTK